MYRHFLDPDGISPLIHHATFSTYTHVLTNMRNLKLHEKIKMVRLSNPSWYPCSGQSCQQWTGARAANARQGQGNFSSSSACQQLAVCTYIRPTQFISSRERVVKDYLRKYKKTEKKIQSKFIKEIYYCKAQEHSQHTDMLRKKGGKLKNK